MRYLAADLEEFCASSLAAKFSLLIDTEDDDDDDGGDGDGNDVFGSTSRLFDYSVAVPEQS